MTMDEKKEITRHISKAGGFNEKTKGYHAIQSLLIVGEWAFYWYGEEFCLQNARWLQYIGLDVEIRSDCIKVTDKAIENYYVNVMKLIPEPEPEYQNLSKRDRRLSIGKEESSTSNWAANILANKKNEK